MSYNQLLASTCADFAIRLKSYNATCTFVANYLLEPIVKAESPPTLVYGVAQHIIRSVSQTAEELVKDPISMIPRHYANLIGSAVGTYYGIKEMVEGVKSIGSAIQVARESPKQALNRFAKASLQIGTGFLCLGMVGVLLLTDKYCTNPPVNLDCESK